MKRSKWFNQINGKLEQFLEKMNNDAVRKFKVDKLQKIAGRIDEFAQQNCEQCKENQQKADQLTSSLEAIMRGKPIDVKQYQALYKELLTHLKKGHGLVEAGQYMNQWLALGLIFGAAFSYFNLYAISLGLLLGIGIGAMLDSDAKKKGKQI
ncbi:hypothetical protein [Bacillus sp. DNRA2]|uniref:hypothetical protein n=1 Tax=Bacillus sp. DNRA2 TaxID=2723053 RepID=UPI001B7D1216|nr:hypothetical protein [Bacillus sp. DNRA2]